MFAIIEALLKVLEKVSAVQKGAREDRLAFYGNVVAPAMKDFRELHSSYCARFDSYADPSVRIDDAAELRTFIHRILKDRHAIGEQKRRVLMLEPLASHEFAGPLFASMLYYVRSAVQVSDLNELDPSDYGVFDSEQRFAEETLALFAPSRHDAVETMTLRDGEFVVAEPARERMSRALEVEAKIADAAHPRRPPKDTRRMFFPPGGSSPMSTLMSSLPGFLDGQQYDDLEDEAARIIAAQLRGSAKVARQRLEVAFMRVARKDLILRASL